MTEPTPADIALEAQIESAWLDYSETIHEDWDRRSALYQRYSVLIKQRSPEQIKRLERKRGLS